MAGNPPFGEQLIRQSAFHIERVSFLFFNNLRELDKFEQARFVHRSVDRTSKCSILCTFLSVHAAGKPGVSG